MAQPLAQLFAAVGVTTKVVGELPEGASHVISLRGLNKFTNRDEAVSTNIASFGLARSCGKQLFDEGGCLIFAFDNGSSGSTKDNRAWVSGISALAKTAQLEWSKADVRSINVDCAGRTAANIAKDLFRAITSGGMVTEMEIDKDGKLHQLIATVADIEDHSRPLNDGDTIVVSGGAKGVTAACLIALSERKKLNIGILGRTAIEDEPIHLAAFRTDAELKGAIFQQATNEGRKISPNELNKLVSKIQSNREVADNIRAITANGSTVKYCSVDITDKKQVEDAIASLRAEFGSIQGIVHAAGVLADKYIHEKTDELFKSVFDTKIAGFMNMLDATQTDRLTHICCFSSVAARMGNSGQADYAMANEILNKVCITEQQKRKGSCVVKSIGWGPWDGGMVSPQLKKHFETMGVDLIPVDVGATMFADEMEDGSARNVEIVVGGAFDAWGKSGDVSAEQTHIMWVHSSNNAFLDSHRIEGRVIAPMMMASEWCLRLAKSVCPSLGIAEVKHLKVYKGIELQHFDKDGDLLYFIYDMERSNSDVVVNIRIENEKRQQMYSVSVRLSDEIGIAANSIFDLGELQSWKWKRKDIYNTRLFHGSDFQVIEKLEGISDEGCKGVVRIGDAGLITNTAWVSDMFLFDGGIQLAILAMDKWTGNNSSLPLGYESLRIFNQASPAEQMHCELVVRKKGSMDSEWDIYFRNADRQLLAEMKGLRMYMHKLN